MRRWFTVGVASLTVMALLAVLGAGWHYSEQILTPGGGALPPERIAVHAAQAGIVTLEATSTSARPGRFGLRFDEVGYALAGPPTAVDADTVSRSFEAVVGDLLGAPSVIFDGSYFPADPALAFDFPLTEVDVDSPIGPLPAYVDDQGSDTWVVFTHGRGAGRREGFRMLSALHDLGLSTLLISYRNDEGAPSSEDGRYGLGSTEWRDLQAAVRHALAAGAERIVLAGASTGGAIAAMFLHQAPEAEAVVAAVLDAPVLDWGPVLRLAAASRGLPTWLTRVAMGVAQMRGIPWSQLNSVSRADEFDVPMLIFHGTHDTTVPLASSVAFAQARPDLVTLVQVPDAEHVQAWNIDPQGYAEALAAFLAGVGIDLPDVEPEVLEVLEPAA